MAAASLGGRDGHSCTLVDNGKGLFTAASQLSASLCAAAYSIVL